jgi:hypothetical protein
MEGWGCCCFGVFGMILLGFLFALALGAVLGVLKCVQRIRKSDEAPALRSVVVVAPAVALWMGAVVVVLVLLRAAMGHCPEAPYQVPPGTFQDSDLVGTWEARYGRSVDRLAIKAGGTFTQVYEDHYRADYIYETGWNEWWVERLGDGRIRLHLQGARYYADGVTVAEVEGPDDPFPRRFFDPVTDEAVDVRGKLVLNVRTDSSGELLLYHLWSYSDEGFALFGCERDLFHRIDTD